MMWWFNYKLLNKFKAYTYISDCHSRDACGGSFVGYMEIQTQTLKNTYKLQCVGWRHGSPYLFSSFTGQILWPVYPDRNRLSMCLGFNDVFVDTHNLDF